jgi:organic radical activating enzyme
VHLETNGTLPPPGVEAESLFDWAVVSPKPPDYFVAPEWEGLVDELKLIADESLTAVAAEMLVARHPEAVVTIQPVWEGRSYLDVNEGEGRELGPRGRVAPRGPSESRALRLVMQHPAWRLSLQTHKYLGIR